MNNSRTLCTEELFSKFYARCQSTSPKHKFRFNNPLYSLDASLIDLSLNIFPWAHYALGKAAMKLHVGLNLSGNLPAFASITDGKLADIEIGRTLQFPKDSIVAFDKGYIDIVGSNSWITSVFSLSPAFGAMQSGVYLRAELSTRLLGLPPIKRLS